jgi:hypothetical protein
VLGPAQFRAGATVREAAKLAALSGRRIARWVPFYGFFPPVEGGSAQRPDRHQRSFGQYAFDASRELRIALQDRDLQHSANRYAAK